MGSVSGVHFLASTPIARKKHERMMRMWRNLSIGQNELMNRAAELHRFAIVLRMQRGFCHQLAREIQCFPFVMMCKDTAKWPIQPIFGGIFACMPILTVYFAVLFKGNAFLCCLKYNTNIGASWLTGGNIGKPFALVILNLFYQSENLCMVF